MWYVVVGAVVAVIAVVSVDVADDFGIIIADVVVVYFVSIDAVGAVVIPYTDAVVVVGFLSCIGTVGDAVVGFRLLFCVLCYCRYCDC